MLNETNTYDKLHQRFNTLNMSAAQQAAAAQHNLSAVSTLNYSQQNQLINKYIQNLNRQLSVQNGLNQPQQQQTAETTPFLIIQNMSDFNTLVNGGTANNFQQDQHTYHEIGDVLLNSNQQHLNLQQRVNINNNNLQIPSNSQQQQQQNGEPNGNELFI